jgi:hypothetical protein
MITARRAGLGFAAGFVLFLGGQGGARAQETPALNPIPAAECQQFAGSIHGATGFAMTAGEDDYTDVTTGGEGRSCHITGSASDQAFAAPADLVTRVAGVFGGWTDEPDRTAQGPDGAEKGYVSGARIATVDVSWEPGPGVACSDKQPLSACHILPQQKLWNIVVDIVEKGGK